MSLANRKIGRVYFIKEWKKGDDGPSGSSKVLLLKIIDYCCSYFYLFYKILLF